MHRQTQDGAKKNSFSVTYICLRSVRINRGEAKLMALGGTSTPVAHEFFVTEKKRDGLRMCVLLDKVAVFMSASQTSLITLNPVMDELLRK